MMTQEETIRVQAGYKELRQQRDILADRCANLSQEVAVLNSRLEVASNEIDLLSKQLMSAHEKAGSKHPDPGANVQE